MMSDAGHTQHTKPMPTMPTVRIASVYLSIVTSTHTGLEGSCVEAYFVVGKPEQKGWRSHAGKDRSTFLSDMAQVLNKHWSRMCKVLANNVWADVQTWGNANLIG